jgi:hypothetical protein
LLLILCFPALADLLIYVRRVWSDGEAGVGCVLLNVGKGH